MNYKQKSPLLLEAKKKSMTITDFMQNVTDDMRNGLIKDVLSKHKNWRKADGDERKDIIAEIASYFDSNYPQVFKMPSQSIFQRIKQKLKGLKLKKQVQESVEDDYKLLDKYADKYHNLKQYELENAIDQLKEDIAYFCALAESAEDANNYWGANTYIEKARELEDQLKVAEIEKLIREEAEKEYNKICAETEGVDNTMNESIDLSDIGIKLVRTATGLRVENIDESLDEEINIDSERMPKQLDLNDPALTPSDKAALEKNFNEAFNKKDDDKEILTEYQKYNGIDVGDKIRIIHLKGEDTRYDGREGVVTHIDDIGDLWGTWGGLAIIPEEDEFEVLEKGNSSTFDEDYSGNPEERTDHLKYTDDDPTDGKFKFPTNITKKNDLNCKKYDIINHTPDELEVLDEDYINEAASRVSNFILDVVDSDYSKDAEDCYCYVAVSINNNDPTYTLDNSFLVKFYGDGIDGLDIEWSEDEWSDPGVYPSNAGGGPLSSYTYFEVENAVLVARPEELEYDLLEYDDFADNKTTKEDLMAKFNISSQVFDDIIKEAARLAHSSLEERAYYWARDNAEYDD